MKVHGYGCGCGGVLAAVLAAVLAGSSGAGTARAEPAQDVYQAVFQSVDRGHLSELLRNMTGYSPVTVGGETFKISDRYLPTSKAKYRKYWTDYFQKLGMTVTETAFETSSNLEPQGHNLEAVLPGKSADSIVIIVHYDSMGPHGADNPAVDDDMTGMAELMETARILAQYKSQLRYTVRFVAADYEEWGGLEGARFYAEQVKQAAAGKHFNVVAAIDDEQAGWNEGSNEFDVFDCGGATESSALGNLLIQTASQYGTMETTHGCMGENSDHYAMWEVGVPAVVFSEHDPFLNDHFDHAGGDILEKIDLDYYTKIAQIGVTFAARVVGLD